MHRKELCVTLVIYQESLHEARSTKYKKLVKNILVYVDTAISRLRR